MQSQKTAKAQRVKPLIREQALTGEPLIIDFIALAQLCQECGGRGPAARWLLALADRIAQPVAVWWPERLGDCWVPQFRAWGPDDWSTERREAWLQDLLGTSRHGFWLGAEAQLAELALDDPARAQAARAQAQATAIRDVLLQRLERSK